MKRNFWAIALLIVSSPTWAQEASISGTLRDAVSNEPMFFTNCVLLRQQDSTFIQGTTSNDDGAFLFSKVDSGSYLLRVTAVGYETYWQRINVPPSAKLGTINLNRSATQLKAVSVTAQRPLYSADGEKTFYHVEDDPSVQTGTASDALQNAPGEYGRRSTEAVHQDVASLKHQAHRGVEQPLGTLRHQRQHHQHRHRWPQSPQSAAVRRLQGQYRPPFFAVGELCL